MKHCAKKLLGFAFALALCLAVGGTALAQTPEFADVPPALPELEMLAYEPNVTAVGDTTIDKFATDGYTVTIPTTVTVNSGDNKGTLPVTAQLKQYRTLYIGIKSTNNWKLQYDGAAGAGTTTPEVTYQLPQEPDMGIIDTECYWVYDPDTKPGEKVLSFSTTTMKPSDSPEEDMKRVKGSSYTLPITVPQPAQATMSGTYSDTLTFTFDVQKLCVTYTINIYKQKLVLNKDGWHNDGDKNYRAVNAVNVYDETTRVVEAGAEPDYTVTLEYKGGDGTTHTWTRPRPMDDGGEDARCWEDLASVQMTPSIDHKAGKTNVTINRNLKYKWYWLDVNGATDYGGEYANGNQGGRISDHVNMQVSVDEQDWTDWFWQGDGDDYWGKFPYGIHFKLGFHHVKNGYVYDEDTPGGNVKICANGNLTYTQTKEESSDNLTTYRVYTDQMTGEPTGTDSYGNVRYCYIPCYKKGITYMVNDGIGGKEDVNEDNPPRTNVLYEETGTLKKPEDLGITAPADKSFAGWSTSADYPTTGKLYKPDANVSTIQWEKYTAAEMAARPQGDEQKRVLYAIWGYDITVQFEDKTGYTADGTKTPVFGSPMIGYSFTLTGQAVEKGKGWTLDLTDPDVITAIDKATTEAKDTAGDSDTKTGKELERKIWKIDSYTEDGHTFDYTEDCTISAAELESGTRTLMIQRRRYLLSVISVDINTFAVKAIATNAGIPKFGTFNVTINDGSTNAGVIGRSHCQVGLNYGAKYTVDTMQGLEPYYAIENVVLKSLAPGDELEEGWFGKLVVRGESYSSYMTGKQTGIHYYKSTGDLGGDGYIGDPVRVVFSDAGAPGSTTPMPGPSLAPGLSSPTPSAGVALRYHANFVPEDALAETVKTVYCSAADVTVHPCMFKRAGYAFVGWNTEEDGTGTWYWVNGVPLTNWRAGETVDLYAQWRKTAAQKPVWDDPDPVDPADPDAPPEWIDDSFDADFGADPDPLPEDPDAQQDDADDAFGVDPDPQPEKLGDAFGADPDPLPDELDDAFGVDPGGDADALLMC